MNTWSLVSLLMVYSGHHGNQVIFPPSVVSSSSCGEKGTTVLAGHTGSSGLGWFQFSYPTGGYINQLSFTHQNTWDQKLIHQKVLFGLMVLGLSVHGLVLHCFGAVLQGSTSLMGWHYIPPGGQQTERGRHLRYKPPIRMWAQGATSSHWVTPCPSDSTTGDQWPSGSTAGANHSRKRCGRGI